MCKFLKAALLALVLALPQSVVAKCGDSFADFVSDIKKEARAKGYDAALVNPPQI